MPSRVLPTETFSALTTSSLDSLVPVRSTSTSSLKATSSSSRCILLLDRIPPFHTSLSLFHHSSTAFPTLHAFLREKRSQSLLHTPTHSRRPLTRLCSFPPRSSCVGNNWAKGTSLVACNALVFVLASSLRCSESGEQVFLKVTALQRHTDPPSSVSLFSLRPPAAVWKICLLTFAHSPVSYFST